MPLFGVDVWEHAYVSLASVRSVVVCIRLLVVVRLQLVWIWDSRLLLFLGMGLYTFGNNLGQLMTLSPSIPAFAVPPVLQCAC